MERKLFFTLISLFLALAVQAQVIIPRNTQIRSELEKETLRAINHGEYVDPFSLQLSVNFDQSASYDDIISDYQEYVTHLRSKKEKGISDVDFLRVLYYSSHKKFLKQYTEYSSFNSLIKTGDYDCLSATIFYALLLDEFDYNFRIVETDYHIYLMVEGENLLVMMESTDPINGFVIDQDIIANRIEEIRDQNRTLAEQFLAFTDSERQFNDFRKLAALQYFNASVHAFNKADLINAVDQLEKARFYDNSDRFSTFGKVLARQLVADRSLDEETRSAYLFKLTRFMNNGMLTASL